MSENNFEKSVQEKMEGFDLLPAPAVWNSVEKRIHEDKKRRFVFAWLVVGLLALGTATIVLINSNKKSNRIAHIPFKEVNATKLNDQASPSNDNLNIQKPSTEQINPEIVVPVQPQDHQPVSNREKITIPAINNDLISNKNIQSENSPRQNLVKIVNEQTKKPKPLDQKYKNASIGETENQKPTSEVVKTIEPKTAEAKLDQPKTLAQSSQPTLDKPKAIKPATSEIKTLGPKLVESKTQPKHKGTKNLEPGTFELAVSLGRSALATGFNLFQGKVNENYLAAPISGPSANVQGKMSSLKPSFSFSAGLVKTKVLSNKLKLNTGISYQFLSVKLMGVSRVDSPGTINNSYSQGVRVDRIYRPDYITSQLSSTKEPYFLNQYHFLCLSADLSWKIIDNKKTSVRWNNGLSFSRLIASNMLHYDYVSKLYYKDNKRLQKNQLFFNTALSIPVGKKVTINPFASFSLTPVLKNYDSTKRYTNYGIRVQIQLNKK